MNYLESEKEANVRDQVFDVLFAELSTCAPSLQLLMSYAISLNASRTLDCMATWCVHNIGNEIVATLFDQIVRDHFLLALPPAPGSTISVSSPSIAQLADKSPMFASLFMSIVLDMLSNNDDQSIARLHRHKCVHKLVDVFDTWVYAVNLNLRV